MHAIILCTCHYLLSASQAGSLKQVISCQEDIRQRKLELFSVCVCVCLCRSVCMYMQMCEWVCERVRLHVCLESLFTVQYAINTLNIAHLHRNVNACSTLMHYACLHLCLTFTVQSVLFWGGNMVGILLCVWSTCIIPCTEWDLLAINLDVMSHITIWTIIVFIWRCTWKKRQVHFKNAWFQIVPLDHVNVQFMYEKAVMGVTARWQRQVLSFLRLPSPWSQDGCSSKEKCLAYYSGSLSAACGSCKKVCIYAISDII